MSSASAPRTFEVRHVQLARAAFAAIAAVMITFSPDHSGSLGLAVFSGFAIASGLVFLLAAWLVHPSGARWPAMLLGIISVAAGMVAGVTSLRSTLMFFAVVIAWAIASGLVETIVGARTLRSLRREADTDAPTRGEARDALTIGIITLVLAAGLAVIPAQYALNYHIEAAGQTFTLTGIVIAVGVFGGYAAIVAVYLAIAGFSPRRHAVAQIEDPTIGRANAAGRGDDSAGGVA
ncbi:acyl-CoA synthetase [Microbacterium rhizomatis]|uniref:acyl-CoA synthetase n=1 Tax=Microbacterium rhizomatis TaxID=1631477 RepID=UPI001FE93113|nr:acyl-CoA synthetase [Microbacterium rhizomatis]